GVDPHAIRKRIESKGQRLEEQDQKQILQRIFDPQFSTRESATEVSGRGVGLDAVLTEARRLQGSAWVESQLGLGSRIFVEVPLFQVPRSSAAVSDGEIRAPLSDRDPAGKTKIKSLAS
ncbi:MAG: ATP-binding protein, partial [Bdellovibrio sp.]